MKFFLKWGMLIGVVITFSFLLLQSKSLVLFSPDDKPTKKLIDFINNTKYKIHAAVYMITDKTIAEALVKAKQRGVDVQIVTDKISMDGFGKGMLLVEAAIPVYVLDVRKTIKPKQNATKPTINYLKNKKPFKKQEKFFNTAPIMHNKFAIFDQVVWTGSFNWTQSANRKNRENVLVTDEVSVYQKYQQEFDFLKTEYCYAYADASIKKTKEETKQFPTKQQQSGFGAFKHFCLRFFDKMKESLSFAQA